MDVFDEITSDGKAPAGDIFDQLVTEPPPSGITGPERLSRLDGLNTPPSKKVIQDEGPSLAPEKEPLLSKVAFVLFGPSESSRFHPPQGPVGQRRRFYEPDPNIHPIPRINVESTGNTVQDIPFKLGAAAWNVPADIVNSVLANPIPVAGIEAPAALGTVARGALATQMASSIPEQVKGLKETKGLQEGAEKTLNLGATLLGTSALAKSVLPRATAEATAAISEQPKPQEKTDASNVETPTTVHGPLREQPVESKPEVPAKESGGGVQPPEKAEGQVPLTPAIQVAGKLFTGKDHVAILQNLADEAESQHYKASKALELAETEHHSDKEYFKSDEYDALAKTVSDLEKAASEAEERVDKFKTPESRNTPDFGFVNSQGQFLTREQAAKASGLPTETEAGKLHSSDLTKEPWQMTQSEFVKRHKEIDAVWQADKSKPSTSSFGKFYGSDYQEYMDAGKYGKPESGLSYEQQKHRSEVKNALAQGKRVPEEVLADYPDLKQKPLNPGAALKDLPPELQQKSNAVKDAMRAEFEKLKAQAKPVVDQPVNKYRVGNNPTPHTLVEKLPQSEAEKANNEQPVRVKNDRTGEIQTVMESDLTPIKEGSKTVTPKRDLDAELRKAGMEPSVFKNKAQKVAALERHNAIVGMGGAKYGEVEGGHGADVYGIAEKVRAERAKAGQVETVEPGQGISAPDSVERGRELLPNTDPEKVMSEFENTKKLSADDMAVARAHGEKLALDARRIEEKFGTDSDEYRKAFKDLSDWDKRSKAMQTEWHKTGQAQQGETDIDTGTFTGMQRAFKADTGKEFTPEQAKKAKTVADASRKAAKASEDARQTLFTALDEEAKGVKPGSANKLIWDKVKDYVSRGKDDFDDIRNKIATDLGMKVDDVTREMAKNQKVKRLADDVWRKQQIARRVRDQAKMWLKSVETPLWEKAIKSIPRLLFSMKVGFHGTVALGTHAPMVAFQPRFWSNYITDFGKMYKMVGSPAYYEHQIQDLMRRPNWVLAKRSGLVNDPFVFEDYNSPKTSASFGRLTGMGNRGYSVLKILRQDMFDQMWNKLPDTTKTPEVAHALADGINHATGVVKSKAPPGANLALFAPRLEMSRVAWLYGDPIRAVRAFANWSKATDAEKVFAINQVKEKAWVAGTFFGALAANQGMLNATGSQQKINGIPEFMGGGGFDPMKGDFMKFKAAGMDASYGNAMLTMARLPVRLYSIRESSGGKLRNVVYPDEDTYTVLGEYGRSQMSPFASLATDLWMKSDWMRRPLPTSNRPMPARLRRQGVLPYTWPEFWSEEVLPIPAEEAAKEVWKTGLGMNEEQYRQMRKAVATIAIMAATGARLQDDYNVPEKPTP